MPGLCIIIRYKNIKKSVKNNEIEKKSPNSVRTEFVWMSLADSARAGHVQIFTRTRERRIFWEIVTFYINI